MKRCPECGFRADDKTCPLCGVKMVPLTAAAKELRTHNHRQTGETCVLPNQKPVKPPVSRPKQNPTPAEEHTNRWRTAGSATPVNPKVWQTVLVIIVVILFRACAA